MMGSAAPKALFLGHKIQRISKIYKGKIFPHGFLFFAPQNHLFVKIGFRGSNPEVQTLLWTPISMAWTNYGNYGNYGNIPNMAIMAIWP